MSLNAFHSRSVISPGPSHRPGIIVPVSAPGEAKAGPPGALSLEALEDRTLLSVLVITDQTDYRSGIHGPDQRHRLPSPATPSRSRLSTPTATRTSAPPTTPGRSPPTIAATSPRPGTSTPTAPPATRSCCNANDPLTGDVATADFTDSTVARRQRHNVHRCRYLWAGNHD